MKNKVISIIVISIFLLSGCSAQSDNEQNNSQQGTMNQSTPSPTVIVEGGITPTLSPTKKPIYTPTPTPILDNYPLNTCFVGKWFPEDGENQRERCYVYSPAEIAEELGIEKTLIWVTCVADEVAYGKDKRILDEFNRKLVEEYNCDFVLEIHDYMLAYRDERYHQEVEIALNRDEQIDIINTGVDADYYCELAARGLLEKWDDEFETEAGRVIREAYPDMLWRKVEYNGEIYGYTNSYMSEVMTWLIANNANAEKYGVSVDEDMSVFDIGDVLKGVQTDGEVVPFGYYGWTLLESIGYYRYNGIYFKKDDNGFRAVNIAEEEEALRLWETLKMYVEEGIGLGAEHLLDESEKRYVDLRDGNFIFQCWGGFPRNVRNNLFFVDVSRNSLDNMECTILSRQYNVLGEESKCVNGIMQSSEYKGEALKLISLLATEGELVDLLKYGFEGEHFEYVDGRKVGATGGEMGKVAAIEAISNPAVATPRIYEQEGLTEYMNETEDEFAYAPAGVMSRLDERFPEQLKAMSEILDEYTDLYEGYEADVRGKAEELSQRLKAAGIDEVITWINENIIAEMNGE